ncbi:MAG: MerR family transcriptional regulator [Clostridiales Family XIII bacterium]|nr:MerR family transcriptional regulator [Clostridiales Family XIII bacterium]
MSGNARYKIGDVARILGISTDLIRYYEERGVVKPHKDKYNNYRYYDAWDVNFLVDCLWYKKMGFSIDEIAKMTSNESYDDFVRHLSSQGDEILETLQRQNLLLERIRNHTESVVRVKDFLGVCDITKNKEFLYYLNRFNLEYNNSQELQLLNRTWEKYMPFTKRLFVIDRENLGTESEDYAFGFSIGMKYAEKFGVKQGGCVKHMRPKLCVHSAFKSFGKDAFTPRHLDFMLKFASKNRLRPAGHAFGNLICSIPEDGGHVGYFEAWIPVEKFEK